eukprot:gene1449-1574_t
MSSSDHSQIVICFLFVSLFVGCIVTFLLSRYAPDLPYTVVLFIIGALFAVAFIKVTEHDLLKSSMEMWDNIEPELILYIFLPALLFGEAMTLNIHNVKGAIWPSVVLAGPGAVFGTFSMAAAVKYCLPYNWNWNLCFVFGAILCATDPVAVVALLKKAGAPSRLTYLIIGEALLNDGSALVLYNLLYTLIKNPSESFTAVDVVVYFVKVIFVSPLLGMAMAAVALFFLIIANRRLKEEDSVIQLAITICCAYLTFFIAEYEVGVSGVISCCAAGVFLAAFASPLILRPEAVHSVWSAFEWIGNTLIFTLAGVLIGSRVMDDIRGEDIGYVVVVFLLAMVLRVIMIIALYPFLKMLNRSYRFQDASFAIWGGLRGAVGMVLALSLLRSTQNGSTNISEYDAHHVFLFVGGVATLTLLCNATTSGWVLNWLGLLEDPQALETRVMLHYVKKRIRKQAVKLLEEQMKLRPHTVNPLIVMKFCSIFEHAVLSAAAPLEEIELPVLGEPPIPLLKRSTSGDQADEKREGSFKREASISEHFPERPSMRRLSFSDGAVLTINLPQSSGYEPFPDPSETLQTIIEERDDEILDEDLVAIPRRLSSTLSRKAVNKEVLCAIRRAFLSVLRVNYWKHIQSGRLPRNSHAARALLNSIDVGMDTIHTPGLQDWDAICDDISRLTQGEQLPVVDNVALSESGNLIEQNSAQDVQIDLYDHDILKSYQDSQLVYMLSSFIEAHEHAQLKIPFYLGESEVIDTPEEAIVVTESKSSVAKASHRLSGIDPRIISWQISKQVAKMILRCQEDLIEEFQEEGIITENHAEALLDELAKDYRRVQIETVSWEDRLTKLIGKIRTFLSRSVSVIVGRNDR